MKQLQIVDMFCGGGGESTGITQAAKQYHFDIKLSAINHWKRAIETHTANYPFAEHYEEPVQNLDPTKVVPGGKLDLLWASPECTHHSNARGGRPRSDQSRATAWEICKWAQELFIGRIIIENVPEFTSWGPLDENGKPIAEKKGTVFNSFIKALESLGYKVEWRVLCAADYGVPTTRRRLFIQAAKAGKKIIWPEPTYSENGDILPRWKAAKDIIDWSIPCPSIRNRKKPLAPATMRRIEYGIKKYWKDSAEPFLAILRGSSTVRSLDKPLPTVTTSGAHYALIQPKPFLVRYNGGDDRVHSTEEPVPTLDTSNRYAVVQPFIMSIGQTSAKDRSRPIDEPLPTVVTKQEHCIVTPILVEYYGNGKAHSVEEPLPTVTTKDRFGLIVPGEIDIGFRMLQPHELAAATGFPKGYKFAGNKSEVVKQIGNAVPPGFANALLSAYLEESA